MSAIRKERLAFIDRAILAVEAAYASERRFVNEPDNDSLDRMKAWLLARRDPPGPG